MASTIRVKRSTAFGQVLDLPVKTWRTTGQSPGPTGSHFFWTKGHARNRVGTVNIIVPHGGLNKNVGLITRTTFYAIVAALVLGCATKPDQIDQLVAKLSPPHPPGHVFAFSAWRNGLYPVLGLAATASADEVVSKALQMSRFGGGISGPKVEHKILKIRVVQVEEGGSPNAFTAVLIQIKAGQKIVLLKYENPAAGWWSRVYDVEPSA